MFEREWGLYLEDMILFSEKVWLWNEAKFGGRIFPILSLQNLDTLTTPIQYRSET